MLYNWIFVGISFAGGMLWAVFSQIQLRLPELGVMGLMGLSLAVAGIGTRMLLNELSFSDTVLLAMPDVGYVWGQLLPIGYWLLAGTAGYAAAASVRALLKRTT